MKKIFLVICGFMLCTTVSAQAQMDIDLGVGEISDNVSQKTLEQNFDQNTTSKKSFSLFDQAVNLFSSSKPNESSKNLNIDELKAKADKGDVEALLDLGYMYLYGTDGIAVDHKQALAYYEKAAKKKNAVALNNLGSLYFNGIGTNVDYSRAISYFEEAAQMGSDDAAVNLAIIYLGTDTKNKTKDDFLKAIKLLEQAQKNNNIAKYLLGYCQMKGFLLKQDKAKAFPRIKALADDGYDEAQFILADFYINGWGTPKNYNRAIQYLKNSAAQGNANAMVLLGDILSDGIIYTRNIMQAHVQYNIASVLGIAQAADKRDALEKNIKIEDLLAIQSEAEDYEPAPSDQTVFIRQTYGDSLKAYIDLNFKTAKKIKKTGESK
ncbi:MAG: sel1 repeat family protein [Acetobacter sp.]|nr:sel1 repeat family protein [Acetobacter sp.]